MNENQNVKLWHAASVTSVHLQLMLLNASPQPCIYFEKPFCFVFFKLWALGGKPLDGSPEVWRSALREATIEIKACSSPTGPCPLQPKIHLHVVTGFWDSSASLTSKSLYTRLWHGELVIVAMFPLHVWRIWSQLYKISWKEVYIWSISINRSRANKGGSKTIRRWQYRQVWRLVLLQCLKNSGIALLVSIRNQSDVLLMGGI